MKPQINIRFGKLIDPFFRSAIAIKYPDFIFPDEINVKEKVDIFKSEWSKYENIIIPALYSFTGLEFRRNIIDVFIVSATDRDMSAPVIIRSRYEPDEFIDVLTHELLHVFIGDNNIDVGYKDESQTVRNHILVHALLKYIYLDVLKDPARLERNLAKSVKGGNNTDYARAWEIVDQSGYMNIVLAILKK